MSLLDDLEKQAKAEKQWGSPNKKPRVSVDADDLLMLIHLARGATQ